MWSSSPSHSDNARSSIMVLGTTPVGVLADGGSTSSYEAMWSSSSPSHNDSARSSTIARGSTAAATDRGALETACVDALGRRVGSTKRSSLGACRRLAGSVRVETVEMEIVSSSSPSSLSSRDGKGDGDSNAAAAAAAETWEDGCCEGSRDTEA
jgi:hypothetical protein